MTRFGHMRRPMAILAAGALAAATILGATGTALASQRPLGTITITGCTPNGADLLETATWSGASGSSWTWFIASNGVGGVNLYVNETFDHAVNGGTLTHLWVAGGPGLTDWAIDGSVLGAYLNSGTANKPHNPAAGSIQVPATGWPAC